MISGRTLKRVWRISHIGYILVALLGAVACLELAQTANPLDGVLGYLPLAYPAALLVVVVYLGLRWLRATFHPRESPEQILTRRKLEQMKDANFADRVFSKPFWHL